MNTERPTHETDQEEKRFNTVDSFDDRHTVPADFARRLEKQRDEAREQRDELLPILKESVGWTHRAMDLEVSFSMQEAQRATIQQAEHAIAKVKGSL